MVYTILFLELISFLPVMGSKQQRNKINFELSKTEHWKIAFKNQYKSADSLYKNLEIIKFQDLWTIACWCVNLNKLKN